MSSKINLKNIKSYLENIEIRGLKNTDEDYVRAHIGQEIFESKNFDDLLNNSQRIRNNLYKLGCFKSVDALVDSSDSN